MSIRRTILSAMLLLLLLAGLAGCRKPQTPEPVALTATQVVEKMQAAYEGITDYRSRMVLTLPAGGNNSEALTLESELLFKKPQMYREEIKAGGETVGQVTITNGRTLWIYTPQVNEVVVLSDLKAGEFTTEGGDLKDEMLTAVVKETALADTPKLLATPVLDGQKTFLLEFTPFSDDFMYGDGPVRVWVADGSFLPRQMESLNTDGSVAMTILFQELQINTGLESSQFNYVPPVGATVVNSDDLPDGAGGTPGSTGETRFTTLAEAKKAVKFSVFTPSYLPTGFNPGSIFIDDRAGIKVLNLEYSQGSQYVTLSLSGSAQTLDSYGEGKKVKIGTRDGQLFADAGVRLITWSRNDVYLILAGNLTEAEMLKVAKSV